VISKKQEQRIGIGQPLKDPDTSKDHPGSTLWICNLLLSTEKQGTAKADKQNLKDKSPDSTRNAYYVGY
jgi:hypothetical protein